MTVGGSTFNNRTLMDMKIDVSFRSWSKHQLECGVKICTTRSKRLGDEGDNFFVILSTGTKRYKLTRVVKLPLRTVYYYYYKQEGYATKEEFGKAWMKIHPYRGLDMSWLVWMHLFEEIPLGV